MLENERQLSDSTVYKTFDFREKYLTDIVGSSNNMFSNLKRKGLIRQKELKYFVYEFKMSTNLTKPYFLPRIHKILSAVPARLVIFSYLSL